MTGVQSKLLELMDEIKSICVEKKLSYVLCYETAAYFADHEVYEDEQYNLKIMMPYGDIIKLEKYVEKNLSDKRIVESWKNNEKLHMLKFRYVDRESLLFDGRSAEHHIAPGVCVTIYPARQFEMSETARACERYLQLCNKGQRNKVLRLVFFKYASRLSRIRFFKRLATRQLRIDNTNYIHRGWFKHFKMTDKEIAKFIMDEQSKATKPYLSSRYIPEEVLLKDPEYREECYAFADDRANVIKLPMDLFTNTSTVTFEDREFAVYADEELFLSALYGDNWRVRSREEATGTDRPAVICDGNLPYQQYLDYIADDEMSLEDITAEKLEYNLWMGYYHNTPVNNALRTFNRARRSVDRIDIWYRLRPMREELREAYNNKNIDRIKSILKDYLKATDKYYEMRIGFYIDAEIFECAKLVWEAEQRPVTVNAEGEISTFADKVYDRVPDIYKTETPDMYFAKRGTKIIDN
ncbi:MAG: LicD family protein [Ruminococcus sp.]|nr:LicD family protein [Ruminococcus sp.]